MTRDQMVAHMVLLGWSPEIGTGSAGWCGVNNGYKEFIFTKIHGTTRSKYFSPATSPHSTMWADMPIVALTNLYKAVKEYHEQPTR